MKTILLLLLFAHPAIEWNGARPLKWTDFTGDYNGVCAASTATELYMESTTDSCGDISFNIKAIFHPELSYISPTCSRSEKTLRHEQLHFDITELYARKLRRKIQMYKDVFGKIDYETASYWYDVYEYQWGNIEAQYDLESKHSQNAPFQAAWEAHIKEELTKLKQYANKSSAELHRVRG
jgi:hypothetical protein